jgi:hypothetical protein
MARLLRRGLLRMTWNWTSTYVKYKRWVVDI